MVDGYFLTYKNRLEKFMSVKSEKLSLLYENILYILSTTYVLAAWALDLSFLGWIALYWFIVGLLFGLWEKYAREN